MKICVKQRLVDHKGKSEEVVDIWVYAELPSYVVARGHGGTCASARRNLVFYSVGRAASK